MTFRLVRTFQSARPHLVAAIALVAACSEPNAPTTAAGGATRDAAPVPVETFYGPERFDRTRGAPDDYARIIDTHLFEAPFTLRLRNGASDGTGRVSSLHVTIDGTPAVGPSDVNQDVGELTRAISPAANATLRVTVDGAPDSYVEISITGRRRALRVCPGDPASYQTLADAVAAAGDDATILLCDGRHVANNVVIDKPLILTAEHAGMATLVQPDTVSTPSPVLRLDGIAAGTVTVSDIGIEFQRYGIVARGTYDQVRVVRTTFSGKILDNGSIGAMFEETTVPTAKVVVDHSEFTGSSVGLDQIQPVDIDITHNSFHDFRTFPLIVYSANGQQNPPPPGFNPLVRTARVLDNTITNCGSAVCLAIEQAGRDTVRFNHITNSGSTVNTAIIVTRLGQTAATTEPIVITDNTITGRGPSAGADSSVQDSWGIRWALRSIGGAAAVTDEFARNTIDGAFVGFDVRSPTTILASDNTVQNTYGVMSMSGNTSLLAHRNDFIGYHYPIATNMVPVPLAVHFPNPPATSLACNYWGGASGPLHVSPLVPAASYVPFATAPIAGSATACDPSAGLLALVRVCETSQPGGPATMPTLPEAYAVVKDGGAIEVCAGRFFTASLVITKGLTLEGEGAARPTLWNTANHGDYFALNVHQSTGPVTIRHLKIEGAQDENVNVALNAAPVLIHDVDFSPPPGVNGNGAGVYITEGSTAGVRVEESRFAGGWSGVAVSGGGSPVPFSNIAIVNNTFTGQSFAGAMLWDNTTATVQDNAFSECGAPQCLLYAGGGHVDVIGNRISVDMSHPTAVGLNVVLIGPPGTGSATIAGNTVSGVGNGSDRNAANSYPIRSSAVRVVGPATVSANTLTNAYSGIMAEPGDVSGSDNVVSHVWSLILTGGGSAVDHLALTRNDFTDYVMPLGWFTGIASADLRCNWWGSAGGPHDWPSWNQPLLFTPVATGPIAGTTVVCTP